MPRKAKSTIATTYVWYSNRRMIGDRVALARKLGLGIGFWRLGREDRAIWDDSGIN